MSSLLGLASVYFITCSARLRPLSVTTEPGTTISLETIVYNAFSIQWKPQICYKSTAENCHNDSIGNITIHGIWPNYYSGGWPAYCPGPKLQSDDVQCVQSGLEIYWPTLKNSNTNFVFWSYEWEKHGVCWSIMNATQYFAFALEWIHNEGYGDIQYILAANGIYASNENIYSVQDVTDALNEGLNQKSVVRCKNGKYINEFFVCRDWFGAKIDCPDNLLSNCNDKVILSLQVLPDASIATVGTAQIIEDNDDLMALNKIEYDNSSSYNIQMFLLITFIFIVLWICATKTFQQFKQRNGYKQINSNNNNNNRHHMPHSKVMLLM